MSFEDRENSDDWQPTISEIADLLQQLQLSPPHSGREIFMQNDSSLESRTNQSESDESSRNSVIFEETDRQEVLEKLGAIHLEKRANGMKNNWFHEYLVEHFTRKQMIHVCSDKPEDELLLQDYLKTLRKLDKQNKKTQSNENTWRKELEIMRFEIGEKKKEAEEVTQSMISMERGTRISGMRHKRQACGRKIEALILKQMEKINKLKIRNKFILIENNLQSMMSSGPNLSKSDYEKLEAEQCYYQHQLEKKTNYRISLKKKNNFLITRIKLFNLKIFHVRDKIKFERKIALDLRKIVKKYLNKNRVSMNKLRWKKKIIRDYSGTVLVCRTKEFSLNIEKNNNDYDDWMKKISTTLKQIKRLGQSLSALRANLILHGKKIELCENSDVEIFEKIVDNPSKERHSPYS